MNGYANGHTSGDDKLDKQKASLLDSISSLTTEAKAFAKNNSANKNVRYEVRTAALALADSLEDPVEQALRIIFESVPPTVALRIALEGGFLDHFEKGGSQTADELSEKTGADRALITRIMRLLTASKMVDETGVDTYAANDLTRAFLKPGIGDAVRHGWDNVNIIFAKLPEYLSNIDWKNPDSYSMGPHTFAFGRPLWKRLEAEPARNKLFNKVMSAFKQNRENWVDIVPFEKKLEEAPVAPDQTLVVDIAGGLGHRLKDFKVKYPHATGKAVLQDQGHVLPTEDTNPEVLAGLKECGIELMEHDIFKPQPIQGAKYYFFSAIFHGRPDSASLELLRSTAPAMKKGYSRILINDFVLPDKGANLFQASFDLWMMADVTGQERTLKEWNTLFEASGLKLVQVHTLGMDSVLEIELA